MTGSAVCPEVRYFVYNGLTIRVSSDDSSHLAWLEEFLTPQFQIAEGRSCDRTVSLTSNDALFNGVLQRGPHPDNSLVSCFTLDGAVVRRPLWKSLAGGERLVFDENYKVFYVVNRGSPDVGLLTVTNNKRVRVALLRVVREIVMNRTFQTGRLVIHGAAVSVGGKGVIIAGSRGTGKTSMLMHLLRQNPARFVANDRVVVSLDEERPTLRGMPTIVKIRAQTLEMFPHVKARLFGASFDHRLTLAEAYPRGRRQVLLAEEGHVSLSQAQFCELLQARATGDGEVAAIVFPEVTGERGEITLEPISPDMAAARLADGVMSSWRPNEAPQMFAVSAQGNLVGEACIERLCRRLTSTLSCFTCHLGLDAYKDKTSAEMVIREVIET